MSHALVIASRELVEKRFVFLAAAAFALVAAVVPFMPGLHGDRAEAVVITATILATAFSVGLATILGASIVGRDVVAGRMSFYFARPIGAAAIWFGKLAAAVVLVVASFVITMVPAFVAAPITVKRIWSGSVFLTVSWIAIAAVVLFFGAHAIGTMIRSRSALIAADFLAAVLTVAIAWLIVRPLLLGAAINAILMLGNVFAVALLVAAIAAGAWQLIDGRTDRRRSHRAFSLAFWGIVAAALLAAALFTVWMVSATPSDLTARIMLLQPSRGDAAILSGNVRHRFDYRPTFLGSRHINGFVWGRFSRDGERAVMLEATPFSPATEIVMRDAAHGWQATRTKIVFGRLMWPIAATDDVARLAAADGNVVTIYDVASSRALGSFKINRPGLMFFATPDVLRVYTAQGSTTAAFEYDVAARAQRETGEATLSGPSFLPSRLSPDGTRMLLREPKGLVTLRDARTLQPIAPADRGSMFLSDGRVVSVPRNTIGEIAPGKLLLANPTQVIDADTRAVIVAANNELTPLPQAFWWSDPRASELNPNGFYRRKNGELVRWNPLTKTAPEPVGRSRTAS